jgi:hypothetical protein
MSLKKFAMALCAVSMLAGSSAFAFDSCQSSVMPMTLSQPAVVQPATLVGASPVCRGRTFLDLQVLFIPLLRLGNRRCAVPAAMPAAAMSTSMPAVISAPAACPTECVQTQPAVIPQPTSKTIMLHDREVNTTTTRIWRRR